MANSFMIDDEAFGDFTASWHISPYAAICFKDLFGPNQLPQTNGNRLRRRLRGVALDIDEMHVEFEQGACLFKVTLRPVGDGQWKVYQFQSHAG